MKAQQGCSSEKVEAWLLIIHWIGMAMDERRVMITTCLSGQLTLTWIAMSHVDHSFGVLSHTFTRFWIRKMGKVPTTYPYIAVSC